MRLLSFAADAKTYQKWQFIIEAMHPKKKPSLLNEGFCGRSAVYKTKSVAPKVCKPLS